jgi:hypothetical protein
VDADDLRRITETIRELTATKDGQELTQALADFGWPELLAVEPAAAIGSLFGAQGRAGSWSRALHDVLDRSGPIGPGATPGSVVLVPWPSTGEPDQTSPVDGLVVGAGIDFESVVSPVGAGSVMQVIEVPRRHVRVHTIAALDARLPMLRVTASVDAGRGLLEGEMASRWWSERLAAGRRALAFGIGGALEAMLGLAVTHASDRRQFDRPIGTFQAVRHRLAECLVAVNATTAAAEAAFDPEEPVLSAMTAKLIAGRSQKLVSSHCQQVLAGVGYTAEHPFHTYFSRAATLNRLLGSADELAPQIGHLLMERRSATRLVNL